VHCLVERIAQVMMLAIFVFVILYKFIKATSGAPVPTIRALPPLDAIKEAIGRAVEMGRPVHHSMGMSQLTSGASETLVSAAVLEYVAGLTANTGADLIVTIRHPEVLPVAQEIVRVAYVKAGKPEAYKPSMIRYLSSTQWSYVAGAMGIMQREKVAANILIGSFAAESILLSEAGNRIGAMQIGGGSGFGGNLAFLAVCCDYCLYADEMYAARAYLTKDPIQIAGISAQDIYKLFVLGLLIIGLLLYRYTDWLYKILSI